jgi:sporulation protein YlmC with PRC-barrel domain
MTTVLARSLSKKKCMTNDGKVIGTLANITVDFDTGQVVDLIIHPDPSFDTSGFRLEGNKLYITFESVKDVKDYIVVDRHLARK